ncbi:phage portal protein, partial [Acinetobacter baumannii]
YSRVIRLEGDDLPYYQRIAENGWGLSVLEPLWDRLIAFDSASVGAGQLVYKAHLRTYSVDGLRNIIAAGGDALKGLMSQ